MRYSKAFLLAVMIVMVFSVCSFAQGNIDSKPGANANPEMELKNICNQLDEIKAKINSRSLDENQKKGYIESLTKDKNAVGMEIYRAMYMSKGSLYYSGLFERLNKRAQYLLTQLESKENNKKSKKNAKKEIVGDKLSTETTNDLATAQVIEVSKILDKFEDAIINSKLNDKEKAALAIELKARSEEIQKYLDDENKFRAELAGGVAKYSETWEKINAGLNDLNNYKTDKADLKPRNLRVK